MQNLSLGAISASSKKLDTVVNVVKCEGFG